MSEIEPSWTPEKVAEPEPRTRLSRLLEILLWVALVGLVASVAIPELAGHPLENNEIVTTLVGFMLLPFLIARMRRASLSWVYPLAGLVLFFAIPLAGGAMRGLEKRSQGNDVLAAIESFEPETAKRARAAEKDPALLKTIMQPAMLRAAQRAPDAELVAFSDALFQLVETPTGINRPRCVAIASGRSQVPPTSAEEMHIAKATARLFRAAASQAQPIPVDAERAGALHDETLLAADRDGLTTDPAKMAAITPNQQCDLYVRMMKTMRRLPEKDMAMIIRLNMTPPR